MKHFRIPFLFFLFTMILCYLLWFVPRDNFEQSLLAFISLSILMVMIGLRSKNINLLILFGIIARITAVFAFPVLSDDIYRFIWDGLLISNGINVYAFTPISLVTSGMSVMIDNANQVYPLLNSKEYYSIYPPITQSINLFAVWVSQGDIYWTATIIKLILALADIGTLLLIRIILINNNKLNPLSISLYALNPVPIIEFSGNGHHEAIVIFSLIAAIYFWSKKYFTVSGSFTGLAISVKLLPIIFIPLFLLQKRSFKQMKQWVLGLIIVSITLLFPLFNDIAINAMNSSIRLYFEHFSINSPLYSLLKWISNFSDEPWKITVLSNYFPILSIFGILTVYFLMFLRKIDLVSGIIIVLTVYLITSRVIHPWYLSPLLALGLIKNNHPMMIWPMAGFLSYSIYASQPYTENSWMILIEYLTVLLVLSYTHFKRKSPDGNIQEL